MSVIVIAVFTLGLFGAYYVGVVNEANAAQATLLQNQEANWAQPTMKISPSNQSLQVNTYTESLYLTVILGIPHDLFPNQTLLNEGWIPDCVLWCFGGIHYYQDPTVHVVNGGIDCIGKKVHGAASGTTCSTHPTDQNVTYAMVSVSGGHTPAFTDTSCPATVETSDGYSIVAGNYTAGTPSSGSATDTLAAKWYDVTAQVASIDLACISWTNSNAANTLYAEGQIGTTTTNPGDSLQTVWKITYSSS